MEITDFLANDNYIIVNKDLIKKIGLNEAVILGELASEYKNWKSKEKLIDDMFYSTISNIEKNTGLNEYQQRKSFKILKELNLIEYKVKGIPATRYIKINQEQVIKILNIKFFNNLSSSSLKFEELDIENLKGNNNISNNNINNNKKEITKEKFETFYSAYPKKVKKADVEKWFIKHKPSDEEFKKIMQGLENYKTIWKDKDKQFIPYPTTWLNGRQWEDEIERKKTEDEIWKEFHDELVARGEI